MERNRPFFSSASRLACACSSASIASLSAPLALWLGLRSSDAISPSRLVSKPPFHALGLGAAPSTPASSSVVSWSLSFEYPAAAAGVPWRAKSSIDVGLTPALATAAVGDVRCPPVWTVRLVRAALARRLAATDVDVDAALPDEVGVGLDALVGVGSDGMVPNGS